jgi:hypothetical protein
MKKKEKTSAAKPNIAKKGTWTAALLNMMDMLHNRIYSLNSSKMFAGIMIIVLNISSKFVNIKLSRSMESFLKYTFSRQILVFAITWMGTRDIYIAFIFSLVFMLCVDFFFHEESALCILPTHFTDYHIQLLETSSDASGNPQSISTPPMTQVHLQPQPQTKSKSKSNNDMPTEEEIQNARNVLEKANRAKNPYQYQGFYYNT